YSIEPEKAMVFAVEDSPVFLGGMYESLLAMYYAVPKIEKAFRTGKALGWQEHDQCLFTGTERFFRTSYMHHLVQDWLPALDGTVKRLEAGVTGADVGCGHGASTMIMARAFPKSRFIGFDFHDGSVDHASRAAAKEGLSDRLRFEKASAKDYPGT